MEEPGKNKKRIEALIPGYEVLKYNEKRIAETFMKWFVDCANHRELLDLCENAARSRFDKITWLKTMRELYRQNTKGEEVKDAIKKMVKIDDNAFLMITAKLEQIVAFKSKELSKETANKVRIVISDDVKNALK